MKNPTEQKIEDDSKKAMDRAREIMRLLGPVSLNGAIVEIAALSTVLALAALYAAGLALSQENLDELGGPIAVVLFETVDRMQKEQL